MSKLHFQSFVVDKVQSLETQLKEAKADADMWKVLANSHNETIKSLYEKVKELKEEIEDLKGVW